jgi:two-component system osmolarity sensor histidine kinase EnvZ
MSGVGRPMRSHVLSRLLPALFMTMFVQGIIGYYLIARPLMQRQAEHFAQFLVDQANLAENNPDLTWRTAAPNTGRTSFLPFNRSLVLELRKRGVVTSDVRLGADGRYWLRWGVGQRWVGYSSDQVVGTFPSGVVLSWLLIQAVVVMLVALALDRSMRRPIDALRREVREAAHDLRSIAPGHSLGIAELDAMRADVATLGTRLKTALDDRTVLLLGLSHELRGPLARLRLRNLDAETLGDVLEMQDAIDQLLMAAQVLRTPQLVPLILAEVIDRLRQRHCGIAFVGPDTQSSTSRGVNLPAIERICSNLIENARIHGGNGRVTCTGIDDGVDWRIEVRDHGPGLANSKALQRGGLGIGLAISRLLAEQNGWSLRVVDADSEGVVAVLNLARLPVSGNITET